VPGTPGASRRLPGGGHSPAKPVSTGRIPCLQGKAQGIFTVLDLFGENPTLKSLRFQVVMANFPKILSRELICWTREFALLGREASRQKAVREYGVAGAALMIWVRRR